MRNIKGLMTNLIVMLSSKIMMKIMMYSEVVEVNKTAQKIRVEVEW